MNEDGHIRTYRTKLVEVKFSTMYASVPPVVSLSLRDATWVDDGYAGLRLDAINVTNAGFKLRCALAKSSNNEIYEVRVRWMSVPQFHS